MINSMNVWDILGRVLADAVAESLRSVADDFEYTFTYKDGKAKRTVRRGTSTRRDRSSTKTASGATKIKKQRTAAAPKPKADLRLKQLYAHALWLASLSGIPKDYILESSEARQRAYRLAAKQLHPDTGAKRMREWHKLQRVRKLFEEVYGAAA